MGSLAGLVAGGKAAGAIGAGAAEANELLRKEGKAARERIEPFTQEGLDAFSGIADLVTNPERQRQFISENPFFESLAEDAQNRLFANQAAKGKLGSGDTAQALQNSLLLLGSDLLNQNVNQRLNIGQLGLQSGTKEADIRLGTAGAMAGNIMTAAGARASGIVSDSNALSNFAGQAFKGIGAFL